MVVYVELRMLIRLELLLVWVVEGVVIKLVSFGFCCGCIYIIGVIDIGWGMVSVWLRLVGFLGVRVIEVV